MRDCQFHAVAAGSAFQWHVDISHPGQCAFEILLDTACVPSLQRVASVYNRGVTVLQACLCAPNNGTCCNHSPSCCLTRCNGDVSNVYFRVWIAFCNRSVAAGAWYSYYVLVPRHSCWFPSHTSQCKWFLRVLKIHIPLRKISHIYLPQCRSHMHYSTCIAPSWVLCSVNDTFPLRYKWPMFRSMAFLPQSFIPSTFWCLRIVFLTT